MAKKKQCPHFKICGAYIIEEKIRIIRKRTGEKVHRKKWSQRFCFADFEECAHFKNKTERRFLK